VTYTTFLPWKNQARTPEVGATPDDRSGSVYLEDPKLRLAAETAIVTQRPLLLRGEPGSGKSSFAPFAARNLGWRYYEVTAHGRLEAQDLLWQFDALARLRDAHAGLKDANNERQLLPTARYVTPGPLWWAFNRKDADEFLTRGRGGGSDKPTNLEPFAELNQGRDPLRAVVLIDEIDKADPDVPNNLLEAFGLNRFTVREADHPVECERPPRDSDKNKPGHFGSLLMVVTTNNERELPAAFLRRCIVHRLKEPPTREALVERWSRIAELHLWEAIAKADGGPKVVAGIADKCWNLRDQARTKRRAPSTAEFLDALKVCLELGIHPDSELFKQVQSNVLVKGDADDGET
jgi:MoxR-like ATPase